VFECKSSVGLGSCVWR